MADFGKVASLVAPDVELSEGELAQEQPGRGKQRSAAAHEKWLVMAFAAAPRELLAAQAAPFP